MHNMIQVGFTLADVLQGSGPSPLAGADTASVGAPGQTLRVLANTMQEQIGDQSVSLAGVTSIGPKTEIHFQKIFETLPATATASPIMPTITSEPEIGSDDGSGPANGFDPADVSPEDRPFDLTELLSSIASGDIDIDEFIAPGTALNEKIKMVLATYSHAAASQTPVSRSALPDIGANTVLEGQDITQVLQDFGKSFQPGSAVEAATHRLQAQVDAIGPRVQVFNQPAQEVARLAASAGETEPPVILPSANAIAERVIQPAVQMPEPTQPPGATSKETSSQPTSIAPQHGTSLSTQPTTQPPAEMEAVPAPRKDAQQMRREVDFEGQDRRVNAADDRLRDLGLPRSTVPHSRAFTNPNASTLPRAVDHATLAPTVVDAEAVDAGIETIAREARLSNLANVPAVVTGQATPAQTQQITRQIAIAIQNTTQRSVEITLNPAELGHVRISLSSADAGLVVSIQADRPETLELMRRNAELLASDFRDIGYDGATFSFEGSSQQGNAGNDPQGVFQSRTAEGDALQAGHPAITNVDHSPTRTIILGDGAIDIRL